MAIAVGRLNSLILYQLLTLLLGIRMWGLTVLLCGTDIMSAWVFNVPDPSDFIVLSEYEVLGSPSEEGSL